MRTLIVGSGFVGGAVARHIESGGGEAVLTSRHRPADAHGGLAGIRWAPLDATRREECARVLDEVRPDAIVLVHGPSDVTWCEEHPQEAADSHEAATAHIAELAGDRRIVMISTDNVFDGTSPVNDEDAPTRPANAYGRAKLRAERTLRRNASDATVLRVSLVYGWESEDATWLNYFAGCVHQLSRGDVVAAPDDHWNTPVHVDDVAAVTAAVAAGPAPGTLHLGGPDRLTRAAWASLIARELGAPPELVRPVPRAQGRYASRPANACLTSSLLATTPPTAGITVRGVAQGVRDLLAARTPGATG